LNRTDVAFAVNPLFTKMGDDTPATAAALEALFTSDEPPAATLWVAFRDQARVATASMVQLQKELADAKVTLQRHAMHRDMGTAGGGGAPTAVSRERARPDAQDRDKESSRKPAKIKRVYRPTAAGTGSSMDEALGAPSEAAGGDTSRTGRDSSSSASSGSAESATGVGTPEAAAPAAVRRRGSSAATNPLSLAALRSAGAAGTRAGRAASVVALDGYRAGPLGRVH
jgi:hypothetical protein